MEKKEIYELLFKNLKQFVQHVHTTEMDTPLYKLLRDFMNEYTSVPFSNDSPHPKLVNHKQLYTIGKTGNWFQSQWNGHHILTKTQKSYRLETMNELFINYIIINQYLSRHVIPTYGFFLYGHNQDGTMLDWNGQKRFCLVQKHVKGRCLSELTMDIQLFKKICKQIINTLHTLEKSSYRLIHNNLTPRSIIIDESEEEPFAVVTGFEKASFTFIDDEMESRIRTSAYEVEYSKDNIIYSGARDMICFFSHMATHPQDEISEYGYLIVKKMYDLFWKDIDTPFSITKEWLLQTYENRWIYKILLDHESKLEESRQRRVHEYNLEQFHTMNYVWLLVTIHKINQKSINLT